MVVLAIWGGVGAVIAAGARLALRSPWLRAISGGIIWPTYPFLIAGSLVRYKVRRW